MTKKIFEHDPYLKESWATIRDTKTVNGETWVALDQTIFYPEGGGQPADLGTIDGIPVLDVQINDNVVLHKLANQIEKSRVKLEIDFPRRFDHMQHHTGQHLLSAVWLEFFGIRTLSFHLGKEVCTIDLQVDELNEEQIQQVEAKLSHYIFENRTVENYQLPYEEIDKEKLVKLKDKPKFVRFIEIEGIDTSTCCGTHVRMLGELGLVKILGWEKNKQNVRLSFVCGARAFSFFQEVYEAVREVSKKLNIPPTLVKERFSGFYTGHQLLKRNHQKLYEKEIHNEAATIISEAINNVIEVSWENKPLQEMKDLAKIIIEAGDKVVIFHNKSQKTWILAASSSKLFHVGNCLQVLKERFGGKGGGNAVFGQWIGDVSQETWLAIKEELLHATKVHHD
ncbi:alanyl-tRNA editing protein [Anaerobacillus alkaliphilus]|nr:alanyl-tRNA editing protein [Anaerobacillus alkaliphilus]